MPNLLHLFFERRRTGSRYLIFWRSESEFWKIFFFWGGKGEWGNNFGEFWPRYLDIYFNFYIGDFGERFLENNYFLGEGRESFGELFFGRRESDFRG